MNDFENRLGDALRHVSEQAPGAAGLERAARLRHRRRRTRTLVGAVVAVALLPAGGLLLSGPWATSAGPGPASTPPSPATSVTPTATPSEEPGPAFIGDTRTSDYGDITVHEVEFPWRVPGATPSKGHQFGALDLEVCSNGAPLPDGAPGRYSPTEFWIIEKWIGGPDEGPVHYSVENSTDLVLREPSLSASQMTSMADGTCARGWLTFELPRGTQIGRVAYQPWMATPVMWRTS